MRVSPTFRLQALAAGVAALAACTDAPLPTEPELGTTPAGLSTGVSSAYRTGQPHEYRSRLAADRCMDVAGASRDSGAQMTLWNCLNTSQSPAPQQTFAWTAAGELKVYAGTPDEKCLDVYGGQVANGSNVIIRPCQGGSTQKWQPGSNGTEIRLAGTTKCIDIWSVDPTPGQKLVLWDCHGGNNQQWDAVTPPTQSAQVLALVGPVLPVGTVESWGGSFARYEQDFRTFADYHWNQAGADWAAGNYYDRAKIYYVWWARTGNPVYRDRADAMAVNYRINYIEANNYGPSAHWSQIEGLALHYLVTGDEASRLAVGRMADGFAYPYYMNNLQNTSAEMENRMQARVLMAFVVANKINAPRGSYPTGTWPGFARDALNKILASQSPDGAYRFLGQCGYNKPFMVGLLNDALIQYYRLFEADPRILTAVKKSLDYMWANDWDAGAQAFVYLGGPCGSDGRTPAPDLSNLISSAFGWVYQQTGDATYRTRGDAVFASGVNGAWLYGSKQFNEEYTYSYKYPAYR